MSKIIFIKFVFLFALLIGSSSLDAKPYVSLSGGFYIEVPDDWEQIDFNTVDLFLSRNKVGEKQFGYDAVLAPSTNSPFFDGNYLIIRIDTVGELAQSDIDTLLSSLAHSFAKKMRYFPMSDYLTDIATDRPNYDRASKLISMYSDVSEKGQPFKKSLLMKKLYNRGVASFYFYSDDSLFETSSTTFIEIIESFSTENIEAMLPVENLKIVDVGKIETPEDDNSSTMLAIYVTLAVLLIIIIRKRRSNKNKS